LVISSGHDQAHSFGRGRFYGAIMRVIATLLVRDEEEIVKECIDFHLQNGIDGFIVTDNRSKDNTRKIVESCSGILEIIDEPTHNHHQSKWVGRMARHAYDFGAHWVVHIDADEFWHGLEILQDPERFRNVGVITITNECVHVPVPGLEYGKFRREQMPYYRKHRDPMPKVIHRAVPKISISHGNHIVSGVPGKHIGTPKGVRIHHYPIRSYEHLVAKTIKGGTALAKHPGSVSNGKRWRGWYKDYKRGKLPEFYAEKLYTPEKIAEHLREDKLRIYVPRNTDDRTTGNHSVEGSSTIAGCTAPGAPEACAQEAKGTSGEYAALSLPG
jgi:hypothetical protein